jgi:hypothetical protein
MPLPNPTTAYDGRIPSGPASLAATIYREIASACADAHRLPALLSDMRRTGNPTSARLHLDEYRRRLASAADRLALNMAAFAADPERRALPALAVRMIADAFAAYDAADVEVTEAEHRLCQAVAAAPLSREARDMLAVANLDEGDAA